MALDREIEQIRNDTARWRALARQLPRAGPEALTDWELDFLEEIPNRKWLEQLSYRQAEILLNIRDEVETVSSYRGYSVKWLCSICHDNRLDLDEEEQAWVELLHAGGAASMRRKDARRLMSLARRLDVIEND